MPVRKLRCVSSRGRHIASLPLKKTDALREIDPLATCLAAALGRSEHIREEDLRRRIRVQPVKKTVIFLLDASDSMLVEEQIRLAKGAVLGLLTQAYQKRYRVGVAVFHAWKARVLLSPTTSIARAREALQAIATGGGTPLADGLNKVLQVLRSERLRHPDDLPQMILITDGKPSIPLKAGANLHQEVLTLAARFPKQGISSMVLSTAEPNAFLNKLALQLKAPLRKIRDVIHR